MKKEGKEKCQRAKKEKQNSDRKKSGLCQGLSPWQDLNGLGSRTLGMGKPQLDHFPVEKFKTCILWLVGTYCITLYAFILRWTYT